SEYEQARQRSDGEVTAHGPTYAALPRSGSPFDGLGIAAAGDLRRELAAHRCVIDHLSLAVLRLRWTASFAMKKPLFGRAAVALWGGGPYLLRPPWAGQDPAAATPAHGQPEPPPRVEAVDPAPERRPVAEATRTVAATPPPGSDAAQGVRGVAVDVDNAPVAGVQVFLQESIGNDPIARFQSLTRDVELPPVAATRTDERGAFVLGLSRASEKNFEVWLLPTEQADQRIGDLLVRAGSWVDLGRITLDAGHSIRGRVVIAGTSMAVPQATVTLDSGDPFLDLGLRSLGGHPGRAAAVDASGRYALEHAPVRGVYRLTAVAPGFARRIINDVDLAAE